MIKYLLNLIFLIICISYTYSQSNYLELFIEDITSKKDTIACIPIQFKTDDTIEYVSYGLKFDHNIISFNEVKNLDPYSSINTYLSSSGILVGGWYGVNSNISYSFPERYTISEVCFNTPSNCNTPYIDVFFDNRIEIIVRQANSKLSAVNIQNGSIKLSDCVNKMSPFGFNYQMILRDIENKILKNRNIGIKFSIFQGEINKELVFSEKVFIQTNSYGLINTEIGSGTNISGSLSAIKWGLDSHYLNVKIDFDGGENYTLEIENKLVSVPFSMHSNSAILADSAINVPDNSPTNEIQVLSISNDTIFLSDGGGRVTLPNIYSFDGDYNNLSNKPAIPSNTSDLTNDSGFLTTEVDGSTINELQALSISNDTIFLSNGGFAKLPVGFDGDYNSLSNKPTIPSNTSDLTNDSGFLTTEVDGSTTNELQALSISNDTIFLSNGGFAKLPVGFDGDYNSLSNKPTIPSNTSDLTNDSGFLTTEVDGSTTNELQALSISNDTIFLSNGGFAKLPEIQLPNGTSDGEILFWYNNQWNNLSPGLQGEILAFCYGKPTWGGCKPIVSSNQPYSITASTFRISGSLLNDGGSAITNFGVCFSKQPNPDISDSLFSITLDNNEFDITVNGLEPNTEYYLKVFATNINGTSYGDEFPITTSAAEYTVQNRLNNGERPCDLIAAGIEIDSLYGKFYRGGYIFYLDNENCSGMLAGRHVTYNKLENCQATGHAFGEGLANTNACSTAGGAVQNIYNLVRDGYDDWYAPNGSELVVMRRNLRDNNALNFKEEIFQKYNPDIAHIYDASPSFAGAVYTGVQGDCTGNYFLPTYSYVVFETYQSCNSCCYGNWSHNDLFIAVRNFSD